MATSADFEEFLQYLAGYAVETIGPDLLCGVTIYRDGRPFTSTTKSTVTTSPLAAPRPSFGSSRVAWACRMRSSSAFTCSSVTLGFTRLAGRPSYFTPSIDGSTSTRWASAE